MLTVGEDVIAIGNHLGELRGTATGGMISALNREVNVQGTEMALLQHDAAVSPGSSGGGLFNSSGSLIGIVNAKASSSNAEGLGFAIPVNSVKQIIDDLINYGYVKGRAYLGVYTQNGDTKNTWIKGAGDIRWGIDIRGGVEATFSPADGVGAATSAAPARAAYRLHRSWQAVLRIRPVCRQTISFSLWTVRKLLQTTNFPPSSAHTMPETRLQ